MVLFEQFVSVTLIGFLVWQLFIPLIFGLPLFPLFVKQKTQEQLVADLEKAKQALAEDELSRELNTLKKRHEDNVHRQRR